MTFPYICAECNNRQNAMDRVCDRCGSVRVVIIAVMEQITGKKAQHRFFSYGGGVQSTGALVLASWAKKAREELDGADADKWLAEQDTPYLDLLSPYMMKAHVSMATLLDILDFPVFLFSNVGDDSEHPDTLRYMNEFAKPYAATNGIELIELKTMRHGAVRTLYQEIVHEELRGIPIPIYDKYGGPSKRSCTKNYKIVTIAKETKRRGATKDHPAIMGLGISIDEYQRMRNDSPIVWQVFDYPLITLRLSRRDCASIIQHAGLPVPPKSACWFCPYTRPKDWRNMQNNNPSLFMNAVVLERDIMAKRERNGHEVAYLSRKGQPLDQAFAGHQLDMFDDDPDDTCESGFCMT